VFSSGTRQSPAMGDESDWVDEDEDVPEFAGGLGQMSAGAGAGLATGMMGFSMTNTNTAPSTALERPLPLVPQPPRGQNAYVRGRAAKPRTGGAGRGTSGRPKGGHSPAGRTSSLPPQNELGSGVETRRWQLPNTRGPAFRHAIQEEDEEEEE